MLTQQMSIVSLSNDGYGASVFSTTNIDLTGEESRRLSEQIGAVNFRLRSSSADYASGFHVAGDPTLLIILSGTMVIRLPNGESQSFSAGDMFIAEDYLADGVEFEQGKHGHMAEIAGDQPLNAIHLKLSRR